MRYIIFSVIFFVSIVFTGSYNGMVNADVQVESTWAQVENQMQRRADLIPNLVESVKGYNIHEQEAIRAVTEARAKLGGASTPEELDKANGELSTALSRLLMVVENYPNLKANEQFQSLMANLEGTENRLAIARKDYVDAVKVYNTKIRRFPSNICASLFGFTEKPQFEADEGAKTVPKVVF